MEMSWLDKLTQEQAEMAARDADPWRLRLERLRGKVGADGIERTTTQTVFDILEIPQRARGSLVGGIASRFVATAAMPGTGAIPTVDWDVKVST